LVEGKKQDVDINGNSSPGSPAGKVGAPSSHTITMDVNGSNENSLLVTAYLLDDFFNIVTTGAVTEVSLTFPGDPLAPSPSPAARSVSAGPGTFSIKPRVSRPDWIVRIATTTNNQLALPFSTALSSPMAVLPGPAHHVHFDPDTNPVSTGTVGAMSVWAATVTAGTPISARVTAHDYWHNILSTGANTYTGTVQFTAESFAAPQDPILPSGTTNFNTSDRGTKYFPGAFILKRAGTRWLKVEDISDPVNLISERTGFSIQPQITITPAGVSNVTVSIDGAVGTVRSGGGYTADSSDTEVHAGNAASASVAGKARFTGQLVDLYGNVVSSAGLPADTPKTMKSKRIPDNFVEAIRTFST
jgi:hypothetical protein